VIQRYREIKELREQGELKDYGFTLIELLIVIVVLGILAAIVIFSLTGVTGQSAQAACVSDAKTVEIAVSAFNAENGSTTGMDVTSLTTSASTLIGSPYLHSFPAANSHYKISIDTAGNVSVDNLQGGGPVAFDTESTAAGSPGCYGVK